jgi:hypothetical protein
VPSALAFAAVSRLASGTCRACDDGRQRKVPPAGPPRERHRTIIDRPFSVFASLTIPTDRPATSTIPGVAFAYPRRINAPSSPILKPLAFISASAHPFGNSASVSSALIWSPVSPLRPSAPLRIHYRSGTAASGSQPRSKRR